MKFHPSILLLTTACFGLFCVPAMAKPDKAKGKSGAPAHAATGKAKKGQQGNQSAAASKAKQRKWIAGSSKLSDNDRHAITAIFRGKDGARQLPPGLAKNLKRGKPLPPGWQKKLSPGAILQQDILGAMTPVSYGLLPTLKQVPDTRLYFHDNRVVRIANATRVILDVINLR